jgi:hypothetical protein
METVFYLMRNVYYTSGDALSSQDIFYTNER